MTDLAEYQQVFAEASADALGYAAMRLGPVAQGRRWMVHHLAAGPTPLEAGTVSGAVIISMRSYYDSQADTAPVTSTVMAFSNPLSSNQLPYVKHFSRGKFVVPSLCSVWAYFLAVPAGQRFACVVHFVDEPAGGPALETRADATQD